MRQRRAVAVEEIEICSDDDENERASFDWRWFLLEIEEELKCSQNRKRLKMVQAGDKVEDGRSGFKISSGHYGGSSANLIWVFEIFELWWVRGRWRGEEGDGSDGGDRY